MTEASSELQRVAETLDESPTELLNGGAAEGLRALNAATSELQGIADARGLELSTVNELWERASVRLSDVPDEAALFPAAAEAAGLLYTAAWLMESEAATTEDVRDLL